MGSLKWEVNKANFHCGADREIGVPEGHCTNKPNLGGPAGIQGELCETNPIRSSRTGWAGGQLCKTNPVSGSWPAGAIPSIPLFYHSTIPVRCRSCQTKPIGPCTDLKGADRLGRKRGRCQGQMCETKPIPTRSDVAASTVWERSYEEFDTQQASTKQSQLKPIATRRAMGEGRQGSRWRWQDASCETKPVSGVPRLPGVARPPPNKAKWRAGTLALLGSIVRNEANSACWDGCRYRISQVLRLTGGDCFVAELLAMT